MPPSIREKEYQILRVLLPDQDQEHPRDLQRVRRAGGAQEDRLRGLPSAEECGVAEPEAAGAGDRGDRPDNRAASQEAAAADQLPATGGGAALSPALLPRAPDLGRDYGKAGLRQLRAVSRNTRKSDEAAMEESGRRLAGSDNAGSSRDYRPVLRSINVLDAEP